MRTVFITILIACSMSLSAQKSNILPIWPGKVPGEVKEKKPAVLGTKEKDPVMMYTEVTDPAIEIFLPEASKRNGGAVIVCPGGGYSILAYDLEGTEIAKWLNKIGYAAFVLQYRVPDKKEGALQDAQRALRVVRSKAKEWNIDPEKTGIMGFSAGGSLSARTSTLFNKKTYSPVDKSDSLSCRPSFTMLIYPAYLDQGPDLSLTPELVLSKDVPPMFIFETADDPYGNSALVMTTALRNAKLPVELHFLPYGGHGYGLRPGKPAPDTWPALAEKWLGTVVPK